MNESSPDPVSKMQGDYFGCDDIPLIVDGPEDNTIRPPRPEYVKLVMERREHHARLMELWKQQQEQGKAKEAPEADSQAER
jgi:hypothetical protein